MAQDLWYWVNTGKYFEKTYLLPNLWDRTTPVFAHIEEAVAISNFATNLSEYTMYTQVQLKFGGSENYFTADLEYVKWQGANPTDVI